MTKKIPGFALFESLISLFILSQFVLLFFLLFHGLEKTKTCQIAERDIDFYTGIALFEKELSASSEITCSTPHLLSMRKKATSELKIIEFIPKAKEIRIRGISGGFQPLLMDIEKCTFHKENEHLLKISLHFTNQKEETCAKITLP